MKVFILGILLVSLYCIEGAVVKREAEGEQQTPEVASDVSFLSQYFPGLMDYFKADTFSDYAAQTQAMFQQVQERIAREQVAERIGQAFQSMLESAKRAIQ